MQYINYFILLTIYINILFTLFCINITLLRQMLKKHYTIRQYKITNISYNIFCLIFYVNFIIIFMYCLRVYNLNKTLNLKLIYKNILSFVYLDFTISYIFIFLCIILFVLMICCILLSIVLIYKYLLNQIFNLYLFLRYNPHDKRSYEVLIKKFRRINDSDIISFLILSFSHYLNKRFAYYKCNLIWDKKPNTRSSEYNKKWEIFVEYCKNRPWYHFNIILTTIMDNNYYRKFIIPFSPILLIIYDCIFNNLIITHVYYYSLIYIPVMLLRKVTILVYHEADYIGELMWDILYKKETCIYALPITHKKTFNIYITNGITYINIPGSWNMDLDVTYFINKNARFIYNQEDNIYYNRGDRSLEFNEDKKLIYQYTDYDTQQEIKEEWILIAVKYHYDNEGKYETIIHVN